MPSWSQVRDCLLPALLLLTVTGTTGRLFLLHAHCRKSLCLICCLSPSPPLLGLLHTGHEAAAHGGDVTSLVLIPSIASRVDLPVIAAGGFANGRGQRTPTACESHVHVPMCTVCPAPCRVHMYQKGLLGLSSLSDSAWSFQKRGLFTDALTNALGS